MTNAQDPYLVFISHASTDRWIARQMASIIERKARRHGVRTFLDEVDLEGGDRVPETIKANLHACAEFVVLLSPYSVAREWVLVELGGAWMMDKRIVAILDKVTLSSVPDIIDHTKVYELNDFERFVAELARRVKSR